MIVIRLDWMIIILELEKIICLNYAALSITLSECSTHEKPDRQRTLQESLEDKSFTLPPKMTGR